MKDPRCDKLAQLLVEYSTALNPGEKVLINMIGDAEPLAKALWKKFMRQRPFRFCILKIPNWRLLG